MSYQSFFVNLIASIFYVSLLWGAYEYLVPDFPPPLYSNPSCTKVKELITAGYISGTYEFSSNSSHKMKVFAKNGALLCEQLLGSEFYSEKFLALVIAAQKEEEQEARRKIKEFEEDIKAFEQELDKK